MKLFLVAVLVCIGQTIQALPNCPRVPTFDYEKIDLDKVR
jgi:hypothetical protein